MCGHQERDDHLRNRHNKLNAPTIICFDTRVCFTRTRKWLMRILARFLVALTGNPLASSWHVPFFCHLHLALKGEHLEIMSLLFENLQT